MLKAKNPVGDRFIANIGQPTIGTDPEVFALDGKGKLFPAFEFLPPKHAPHINNHKWGTTNSYWDGFQAEYRFSRGYSCFIELMMNVQDGLNQIATKAKEKDANAKLTLKNVFRIPAKTLKDAFDPHVELGCEPSFNAYGLKATTVENPRELRYRFAGGHMHFGTDYAVRDREIAVKTLDKILGLWSIGAAKSIDNPIRRRYYGLPGEYRKPKYGVEYRVLSNFWLSHPIVYQATWEIGRMVAMFAYSKFADLWVAPEEMVIEAITNSDTKIAKKLLELNKPIFLWLFGQRGWSLPERERLFNVGIDGIESIIRDPEDIEGNWKGKIDPWGHDKQHTWLGFVTSGDKLI